jgi:hypothetical protein
MIDADTSTVSWDDDREVYVNRFDDAQSPSVAVAETLETALPDEDRPLFEYVDPDALDALVGDRPGASSSSSVSVTFQVEDVLVTVRGEGRVSVRP